MEDMLVSDFISVQSATRLYSVFFRESVVSDIDKACEKDAFFVIDSHVCKLYAELFIKIPQKRIILIEPTEENKSIDKVKELIECLVEKQIRKNNPLVAIGGGIVQDITAFAASLIYRGIEWQFIPTTLLAQADSCVGSKTSINLGKCKNLIGNFYPPSNIFIDVNFLKTLEKKDIQSGIGEMMHFYLYAGSCFMEKLIENYHEILANRSTLRAYIQESLSIKKSVAEIDEYDKDERNKFNYGHTFGHALETVSNYEIRHGQAVTIGMDLANYISSNYGVMTRDTFDRLHQLLKVNMPAYNYRGINLNDYFQALSKDKKNLGNDLVCILAEKPGKLIKQQMKMNEQFQAVVREYFQGVWNS
ncbi:MAG: 3-dehydroquinate synthase [Deltaproteobacteria bacterium CG11_big_fil_rev_8_21_14_0_20_42_23]|nr:MAG: 3-dehydroquinate synthase [Deltaproteobacteria bacterium CG11_big_fil_rev_8_21_14_0_20_42_23]PJC64532.1 MAG: 3-dehydroquinate synthase [Deltaproteobacteria bacterium CG_4_9_14_0_2_um_filter_42_21]